LRENGNKSNEKKNIDGVKGVNKSTEKKNETCKHLRIHQGGHL